MIGHQAIVVVAALWGCKITSVIVVLYCLASPQCPGLSNISICLQTDSPFLNQIFQYLSQGNKVDDRHAHTRIKKNPT